MTVRYKNRYKQSLGVDERGRIFESELVKNGKKYN